MAVAAVPRVPSYIPYLGHGLAFGRDADALLVQCQKKYGDVFELKAGPRLLADLDRYEGFAGADDDWFHRVVIEVALDLGGTLEAWAYNLCKAPRARLIGSGDFIADRRMRVPRAARP